MVRLFLITLFLLLSVTSSQAGPLQSSLAVQTPVRFADGAIYETDWANRTTEIMYVKRIYVSHGVDYHAAVDVSTAIYRATDMMLVVWHRTDAHAPAGGPLEQWYEFAPDYVLLQPGDGFRILTSGAILNVPDAHYDVYVMVYYTLSMP